MSVPPTDYRYDIDGLRALAVIIVILNHLDARWCRGGFVGVDVFFVISGYVITRNIDGKIERGPFSLTEFYERRIRRLLPGLALVVAFSVLVAWNIMLPRDFVLFAESIAAVSCGVSNFYFCSPGGYFEAPSVTKPMLHTWSLGVEEQFYLVYPALLILLHRVAQRRFLVLLCIIGTGSLALSCYGVVHYHTKTFYWMPTRLWELLAGGLIFLAFNRLKPSGAFTYILSYGGLMFIGGATLVYSAHTLFPGPSALAPVLGACGLILSGQSQTRTFVFRLLSSPPLVYLGKISYLLYLTHWPIIVLWSYYKITSLNGLDKCLVIPASIVLSAGIYSLVEGPIRNRVILKKWWQPYVLAVSFMLVCCALAYKSVITNGLPGRFGNKLTDTEYKRAELSQNDAVMKGVIPFFGEVRADRGRLDPNKARTFGGEGPADLVFFGDSHALSLFDGVVSEATARHHRVKFFVDYFSPPALNLSSWNEGGLLYNQEVVSLICADKNIKTVVITANWTLYLKGGPYLDNSFNLLQLDGIVIPEDQAGETLRTYLTKTLKQLVTSGKQVFVLQPFPDYKYNVQDTLEKCAITNRNLYEYLDTSKDAYLARHGEALKILERATVDSRSTLVPVSEALWDGKHFIVVEDGVSLYEDYHHLSPLGGRRVAPFIFDRIYPEHN